MLIVFKFKFPLLCMNQYDSKLQVPGLVRPPTYRTTLNL